MSTLSSANYTRKSLSRRVISFSFKVDKFFLKIHSNICLTANLHLYCHVSEVFFDNEISVGNLRFGTGSIPPDAGRAEVGALGRPSLRQCTCSYGTHPPLLCAASKALAQPEVGGCFQSKAGLVPSQSLHAQPV